MQMVSNYANRMRVFLFWRRRSSSVTVIVCGMNWFVRKQWDGVFCSLCICTCCVARSSCRGCESDRPIFQGETACERAPSSHTHPGANESNYAPSLNLHQAARYRQIHPSCWERKTGCFFFLLLLMTHRNTPTHLSVPAPKASAPRVNPTGQCCPCEADMLAWQTVPPGGLGINRPPASFWLSSPPGLRK